MGPATDVREPLLPELATSRGSAEADDATAPAQLPTSKHAHGSGEDSDLHSPLWPDRFRHGLSIDDVLTTWAGEFGFAQFIHFMFASFAWTLEALQTMLMIFADKTPTWKCIATADSKSSCLPSSSLCSLDSSLWEWVGGIHQSTVSEWELICGEEYKVGLVQSAFFLGALLGAGLFGHLSDSRLGRKGTLVLVCILNSLTGILTGFAPNYWVYFALRMATGISAGSLGLSSFVLATEPIGPSKRGAVGMSTFYFFSGGIMLLSGLALLTPSWRQLCIVSSIPSLVYGILVVFFLEESPRWYLVQGRVNDAMKVLASIARWNGKFIPEDITVTIEKEEDDIEGSIQHEQEDLQGESVPKLQNSQVTHHQASGTIFDVFRVHPTRIRMFIMTFIWLFVAVVYYGVSLNVSNLGTNLYLSVLLNALAEMPAFVLTAICLEKYGRKRVLIFALLLGAVCCLLGSLVPEHEENGVSNYHLTLSVQDFVLSKTVNGSVMRLVCGMVAIFAMAGAYNLLYIYTAELFPTVVRNAALGFTSQAAQIGAIVAPMVVVLGKLHGSIPFASFSVVSFLGGLIVFKLPETLHRPLYETFEGLQRSERIRN